jgi:hypothetical protein
MALDGRHPVPGEPPAEEARLVDIPLLKAQLLTGDEELPCGRTLRHAWEQARDSGATADPHATNCPHCQQAAEGLAALDRATRALRAKDRPHSRSLADRVMKAVRAEVRLGAMLPLDDPAQDLRIAERAAAKVLRRAADSVPGARAASCRLVPTEDGTAVHAFMTLATTLDQPLPDRAAQVRRAVLHAADHELGLAIAGVDLRIDLVLEPADTLDGDMPEWREQR